MLENGIAGLALVFVLLAVFLELRLAFWVSLGIPISFLGTFMLMPVFDVTANIVSTFAFILVLGIVVDDAIIVGENVYRHQRRGRTPLEGALAGVREVATPVLFAVLTTAAAFSPLLFVPGMLGKMMRYVPLVVIPCVLFSLVESLHILPAHPRPPAGGTARAVVAVPARPGRRARSGRRPRLPPRAGGEPALAPPHAGGGGVDARPGRWGWWRAAASRSTSSPRPRRTSSTPR